MEKAASGGKGLFKDDSKKKAPEPPKKKAPEPPKKETPKKEEELKKPAKDTSIPAEEL